MTLTKQADKPATSNDSPRVDYHCHISMTEYADIENPTVVSVTLEEFLADLNEAGFQKAVVLSDKRTSPEQVSAFVSRAPDRLIGFGYVNPTEPGSGDEVLKQREELGLFGLKLYPTTDGYLVNDPDAFPATRPPRASGCPSCSTTRGCPTPGTC